MRERWNGSIQSHNTPSIHQSGTEREDFNMFRCMITKVLYVDDPNNISKNARNPSVLYEAVILGGFKTGQTLFPCRMASELGGNFNFSERTLKATTKDISKVKLSDHDGDIVYIEFIQGHDAYPVIRSCDKGINDSTSGTKSSEGPRSISQYNGIYEEINNQGEWSITRKGGALSNGSFSPASGLEGRIKMVKNKIVIEDGGRVITIDKSSDDISIVTAGGAKVDINGGSDQITATTSGGAKVTTDGSNGIKAEDGKGGVLKIANGKVGLGGATAEIVDALSKTLQLLATDLGNLGYPLFNSPQYAALKVLVDGIKGGI